MYRPKYLKKREGNLLEIKLKDMHSVPEVYYKGGRVFNKGMNTVEYRWKSRGSAVEFGNHLIKIKGFDLDGRVDNKRPVLDTIEKER